MNSYEIYRAERRGAMWHPVGYAKASSAAKAIKQFAGERRGGVLRAKLISKNNPSGRKLTKAEKRLNASKRSKLKRQATALKKYLQALYPGQKFEGAQVRKNPGKRITITPIRASKRR